MVHTKKLPILKFDNFIFRFNDINTTIRLGKKYALLPIGGKILLKPNKKNQKNVKPILATINFIFRCKFIHIPDFILTAEHDPDCQSLMGLFNKFKKIYGEKKVSMTSDVTCIGFIPIRETHHLETILRKMCDMVGAKFEEINFQEDNWWWLKHEWTKKQEEEFFNWLTDYLYKNAEARRAMGLHFKKKDSCRKVAKIFIFTYGWKVKDE